MKYQIIDKRGYLLIKISGETRANEPLLVKKMLLPYLNRKEISVVLDLNDLVRFEPVALVGVLNGIKKEVDLLKGQLKLCSLRPELIIYFRENRLDRIFRVCEDNECEDYIPKEEGR